jgi:transcriptional regulator with XRE-family HTH domain
MQVQIAIPFCRSGHWLNSYAIGAMDVTPKRSKGAGKSPTLRRRRLGAELRHLRELASLTIEDVAKALECSDSKISRIETGQVSATPRDVRDMLHLYGVSEDQEEILVQAAREARQKAWWQAYSDTLIVPLVGLETAATSIRAYEAMVVPGLFQTRDYAAAVIRAHRPDLSPDQVERWVEFRIARQALLTRDGPPALQAVIDEAALRRPVGSLGQMRKQLHHLTELAAVPTVEVRILPFAAGEHGGMSGAFTIFGFDDPIEPDVVYLEQTASSLYIDGSEEVRRYTLAFENLRAAALTADASTAHLAALVNEL